MTLSLTRRNNSNDRQWQPSRGNLTGLILLINYYLRHMNTTLFFFVTPLRNTFLFCTSDPRRSVTPAITNDPRHYQGNSDYCLSVALCPSAIIEFQEHARKYGWLMVSITLKDADKCLVAGLQPATLRSWIKVPPKRSVPMTNIISYVPI